MIPGGKPAVGIPYWFENWTWGTNRSQSFHADTEGETDGDGRIRLRLGKSQGLAIYLGPPKTVRARFPYAPYQHYWGTARPSEHPDVWAPTDLGRIVLSRGIRLSGRMVDTEGRPIEGQNIRAFSLTGREQHTAATDIDGTFSLGPLRPANYLIYGDGQEHVRRFERRYPSVAPADPCRAPGAGLSEGRRAHRVCGSSRVADSPRRTPLR